MNTLPCASPAAHWLAATVRPYSDEGELLAASETARTAADIRRAALGTLSDHVRSVVIWNGRVEPGWRLGDYAYYVLSFSPSPQAELYVQLWSEPEQPVLVEVCSGHWNESARTWLTDDVRERIRDRGFSIGGRAENYQKRLVIDEPSQADGLAREVLDLVVGVLGYDGKQALRFQRCLETRAKGDWVYHSLNRAMLVSLMRQTGYVLEPEADRLETSVPARTPPHLAVIHLAHARRPDSHDYTVVTLRGFLRCAPALAQHRASQIHEAYNFVTAHPQPEQEVVVLSHSLLLDGGVTEEWLKTQLETWKVLLARIHDG